MHRSLIILAWLFLAAPAWASCPATPSDCPSTTVNNLTMGGKMQGSAATSARAPFNLPPGTAPALPNNGDLWSTSAGYFGRANGITFPLGGGSTPPGGSNGQVQFNNSGAFGGLTNAQLTALINSFSSSLPGAAPASGGGTANFLRADGTWHVPPGTGGSSGLPVINAAAAPYNVACDGTTDDTAGINAALAGVAGQAAIVIMPAGHCKITSAINILISGTQFIGQGGNDGSAGGGSGTALVPNFATGDAMNIGSTAGNVNGTLVQGIAIVPSVSRTAGAGIHLYAGGWNIQKDIKIYNMHIGMQHDGECQPAGTGNCDYDNLLTESSINSNAAGGVIIGATGSTTSNGFPQNVFISHSDISVNGVAGIIVRNCGGCVFRFAQGILNDVGMLVNPGNNQLTLFQASDMGWDTSTNAGLDFEATGSGQVGGTFTNGWYASSGTGGGNANPLAVGIRFNMGVAAFQPIQFVGGSIYNNAAAGVFEAQQTKYVSFIGVNNFSNSAYSGGGPVCPTATPACNNNGNYPNYLGANGTTNLTIDGGLWGVGHGLTNWPSFGIDFAGSTITNIVISGINVAGTVSSGSCTIGGGVLTGGIRCGSALTSAQSAIVGVTGGGGGGAVSSFNTRTGAVTLNTGDVTGVGGVLTSGGASSNIPSCGAGCASIVGSSVSFGGSSINMPGGWGLNAGAVPFATIASGGAPCNIVAISGGGSPDISGTSLCAAVNALQPPNNTLDLGDGSHFWKTVFAITGTINTSDARSKTAVKDETLGCSFIERLHPVSFRLKEGDDGTHHGLIAQELDTALDGAPFAGLYVPKTPEERYGINYSDLIAPLIKCAQEKDSQIFTIQVATLIVVIAFTLAILFVWYRTPHYPRHAHE